MAALYHSSSGIRANISHQRPILLHNQKQTEFLRWSRGPCYYKVTEITAAWVLLEAGVNTYLCFCQQMLPWAMLHGRHLQHLLVWVLHGDGAGGKSGRKWPHSQLSSARDWMCVSARAGEKKFAHASSRAAAELDVAIKRLTTEGGQPTPTAWSDHAPLSAMEKGDVKEMLTSGFWGNIFLTVEKPP